MNKRLEKLLLEKSFQQLDAEEKFFVTETVSGEEFERMHFLLKNSKQVFENTPSPNQNIKSNLLAAMRKQHQNQQLPKPGTLVRMLRYRIPVWQAAAAVAFLLGLHFWLQEESTVLEKTETVYVHSTDTIYKEVSLPSDAMQNPNTPSVFVNTKPQKEAPILKVEPTVIATVDSSSRQFRGAEFPDTFSMRVSRPRGQSASETADLWESLEEVY